MSDMFTDAYGGDRPNVDVETAMWIKRRWEEHFWEVRREAEEELAAAEEARRKAEEAKRKAEEAEREGYRELLAEIAEIVGIEDAVDGKEPGEYRQLLIDRLTERLGKQGDAGDGGQDAPEADDARPVSEEQRRWEAWADGLVAKIDAGERLTRGEIADMVFDDGLRYDEERGYVGRWTQEMTTYLRMRDGRFFCIEWEKGLTEYQENEYPCQPYEVVPHDVEKVVTERTWETVGRR